MPSLNITFTDEEHRLLTEAAAKSQESLKTFVHDAAIERSSAYRERVVAMSAQIASWSAELNERLA
ncbi:DUF1778 domain-containing protein [Williamsia sp. D3]|uniref:DUF1778 domain-containing protein n=1 Tax=Williamsia sp. D3 TaxID=1313067 RepID=UPI0003D33B50|nr:DUF1778 domain-containing protein [Williamsia sp. D3]ETD30774.1 hypothetical protein W823_22765 [Williamsia sp. D3]PZU02696.1 MAG: antitoxin Phd [Gordonia sp. (in: high G+C Gram-positive bacteria)]